MRKKTPMLPRATRQRIGVFKRRNPIANYFEIADKFNCTYDQARRACHDYEQGKLTRNMPKTKQPKPEINIAGKTTDQLLESQFEYAIASLESDADIPIDSRVQYLDKLFGMRKIIQQVKLESHIKRLDATIIGAIIRRYEPDASDERVIEIYKEEFVKLKG